MTTKILKLTPLTEATYYTLLALNEPLHGYGIIKKVEEMTSGRLILAAGTLYGVLTSLQKYQLIELDHEEEDNKKKKVYRITPLGRDLLDYELRRLEEMVANGKRGVSK
ncbi:PadR family transcriptional regulator [Candidatus Xianfuyuplasma coldseepsis]|uniref:PadR family transcriptional regulator n=1 Tax=Candidatus Xianfuyuplasma coldseepsis TaxID=2782163 RepID=A0A7L7KTE1_9MOLU|nr:PadR family transcriptional regulator [Xianfuyuplasma coldseepsis]QMS85562.1 PadR family transcriptional regulator [Xianfuyuplasma coldseepsis]